MARAELETQGRETVVEEFVSGPSLSLEVIAWCGVAQPLLGTEFEVDRSYDCKRVLAPVGGPEAAEGLLARFEQMGKSVSPWGWGLMA